MIRIVPLSPLGLPPKGDHHHHHHHHPTAWHWQSFVSEAFPSFTWTKGYIASPHKGDAVAFCDSLPMLSLWNGSTISFPAQSNQRSEAAWL
jgi:hypothetical protein